MRLKADNRNLTENQPKTILTDDVDAGATTITVGSNDGLTNGNYLLLGIIGEEKSEIVKINGAITHGTSLTVTTTVFNHDVDTPVTKIDYNQIRFYQGSTAIAADSTALAAAQDIDPTEIYSYYEDTLNTTGYGFCRFYNSTSANYSTYSDAINYSYKTGYTNRMLRSIRKNIRKKLKEVEEDTSNYTNDEIDEEINMAQKEIAHDRLWSFHEKIKSLSSVANKFEYDLASNVFVPFEAKFKTQPLLIITMSRWNMLRWDSDVSGDPTHIALWGRKAYVYPYNSSAAASTTLGAAISSTTATTITVASNASFPTQGRIIIDSEVISYTGKSGTTGLTGCVRGEEGTTAATHSNGATVTERDLIYHFQEDPDDLTDETDETAILDPMIIVYKVCAELSESTKQDRFYQKYNIALKQLRKVDGPKIKAAFGTVVDASNVIQDFGGRRDQNEYPTNLTGA